VAGWRADRGARIGGATAADPSTVLRAVYRGARTLFQSGTAPALSLPPRCGAGSLPATASAAMHATRNAPFALLVGAASAATTAEPAIKNAPPATVGGASAPTIEAATNQRPHRARASFRLGLTVVLLLSALTAAAKDTPRRILIAGDSTAAEYGPEHAPQAGWGQVLQSWFDPAQWEVRNHAKGGRSARSFIEEGRLAAIGKELRRGDVLLVQFGHNDAKLEDPSRYDDPAQAYPQYLSRYLDLAEQRGATPILITPVARLLYDFGSLLDTHGLYTQSMKQLAAQRHVALIDLNASSSDWVRALGEQAAQPYFLFVPEQGKADGTHFSAAGANAVACLVVRDWTALEPSLKPQLKRDIDCGAPATAAADRTAQANPSLVVHERDIGKPQPGPHGGAGPTTAYSFFADQPGLGFVLRKRVLHPGAGIGLHQHHKDEVYYVVSGRGLYALDGKQYEVGPGDALLTRSGSTHAIQQTGSEPLVILLSYLVAE